MLTLFDRISATMEQVKFMDKTNKIKTFTSLSQIGVSMGWETIDDIVNKMPRNSVLVYKKASGSGNASIYPAAAGKMTVQKVSDLFGVYFEFENEYYKWVAHYNKYYGEEAFIDWVEVSKGAITDFTGDLNSVTTPFLYATRSAKNLPDEASFYVLTLSSRVHQKTHRKQIAYRAASGTYVSQSYVREMIDGVWNPWRMQIPTYSGEGSPEGKIAAPKGSLYMDLTGGSGSVLYVKEGGAAGNTGWAAK